MVTVWLCPGCVTELELKLKFVYQSSFKLNSTQKHCINLFQVKHETNVGWYSLEFSVGWMLCRWTDTNWAREWNIYFSYLYIRCIKEMTSVIMLSVYKKKKSTDNKIKKIRKSNNQWTTSTQQINKDMCCLLYLCIHEEVPHQGHGLLQCLLLRRTKGRLLRLQGLGSSHHEACNLVIQAVQRLHS